MSLLTFFMNIGNFTILPEKHKLTDKELIVLVHTRPLAIEKRMLVRDSWGKHGTKKLAINSIRLSSFIILNC